MRRNWTEEEVKYLEENYETTNYGEIGIALNRTHGSVKNKVLHLGHRLPEGSREVRSSKATSKRNLNLTGNKNPNWKGGISKNHYHYKKLQVERYPERVRARRLVYNAIKSGKLIKTVCEYEGCEETEVQGHHEDYSKPLEVNWLCKKHHDQIPKNN